MDNNIFREELTNYVDSLYTEFEKYQSDVFETLVEFKRLAEASEIPYYVGFGSLLGVIRDGDLLPWDYDIDVVLSIEYKDLLLAALENKLSDEFYYCTSLVQKKCRHYCIRITKNGFNSSAVHLDIFFLIGSPTEATQRERFRKKVKWINKVRKIKLENHIEESMGIKRSIYSRLLRKIVYLIVPIRYLDRIYNQLVNLVEYKSAEYVSTMQAAADTYEKNIFREPSTIVIRGVEFMAPTSIDDFLQATYKNFEAIPPIDSRFKEFYDSITRLKYFHSNHSIQSKVDWQVNNYE